MRKVYVGILTLNNLKFTKMCVNSIRETTEYPIEFIFVDNGSTDGTPYWIERQPDVSKFKRYDINMGLPCASNDIIDMAWEDNDDAFLIFAANDIIVYKYAIDHLIRAAEETNLEIIGAIETNVNKFLKLLPNHADKFNQGSKRIFDGEVFNAYKDLIPKLNFDYKVVPIDKSPNRTLAIRKKSYYDKVGYLDVNFYPAYFNDNDQGRRAGIVGVRSGRCPSSHFFHFWSRSIYQGGLGNANRKLFEENKKYYISKWGGAPGNERWIKPFNEGNCNISTRDKEWEIIKFWRKKAGLN